MTGQGVCVYHSFRDTAQQHVHEAGVAMCAQHDEIDVVILRITNDLHKRNTLDSFADDIVRLPLRCFEKFRHALEFINEGTACLSQFSRGSVACEQRDSQTIAW